MTDATAAGPVGGGIRSRSFLALALVYLAVAVNGTVSNIALPSIALALGADTSDLAWIVNATPMAGAAVLLFAGGLADRFGRQRVLYAGIALFAVSALGSLLVHSPVQLAVLRTVSGISTALILPAALALVFTLVVPASRSTAVGLMSSTQAVGSMLGPLLGGLALLWFAWPAAFLVVVPFLLLATVMLLTSLPRGLLPPPEQRPRMDLPGSVLAAATGLAVVYALVEAPVGGGPDWLVALGVAAVAGVILAWWERRIGDGLLDPAIVTRRSWLVPSTGVLVVNLILGGVLFVSTQYTQLVLGYSPLGAGLLLLPALAVWAGAAAASGPAVRRIGHRAVLVAAFGIGGLGLALVAASASGPSVAVMVAGLLLVGSLGAAPAQLTHLTVSVFPASRRGAGAALNSLLLRFGLVLGVAGTAAAVSTVYADRLHPTVVALTEPDLLPAMEGLAAALTASQGLAPGTAAQVTDAARDAFVAGYQAAVYGCAALAVAWAAVLAVGLSAGVDRTDALPRG